MIVCSIAAQTMAKKVKYVYLSLFVSIQGTHFITQDLWYIFNNSNRVDGGTSQDQKFGRFLESFFEVGWSIYDWVDY